MSLSIIVVRYNGRHDFLEIEVRGKRGIGYCKSMPGAVHPFPTTQGTQQRQADRSAVPKFQKQLFNAILNELDMKQDRDGNQRTAYSLRHTYICFRLMEAYLCQLRKTAAPVWK